MHIGCKRDGLRTEKSSSLSNMRTGDYSSDNPWATSLDNMGGLHKNSTESARRAEMQSLLHGRCMNIENAGPIDCGTSDNRGTEWIVDHGDQHEEWDPGKTGEGRQNVGDSTKHDGQACQTEVTTDEADW